jgi:copper chaperone NosL
MNGRTSIHPTTALVLALLSASCGASTPREIVIGQDQCTYCRMEVTDPKFATQVILTTGKIVVFDAVDCLAGYVRGNPAERIKSVWVAAADGSEFVRAEEAGFLLDGSLRGPMGRIVAFASPTAATAAAETYGGRLVSWQAILSDSGALVEHGEH